MDVNLQKSKEATNTDAQQAIYNKLYDDNVHAPIPSLSSNQKATTSMPSSAPYMSTEWLREQEGQNYCEKEYDPA